MTVLLSTLVAAALAVLGIAGGVRVYAGMVR